MGYSGQGYSEGIPISLNADGSGWIANNNFSWDGNGNISLTESFVGSIFNVLKEGYRNEDNAIFLDETGL